MEKHNQKIRQYSHRKLSKVHFDHISAFPRKGLNYNF